MEKVQQILFISNNNIHLLLLLLWVFSPWAETRAKSGDWYSSGMLHPVQVLRGRLPLLSPAF